MEFKEIIVWSKKIVENIDKIDDIVDSYLKPAKDFTDTAQYISLPIKGAIAVLNWGRLERFKNYLKSYAKKIKNKGGISDKDVERFKKYLSKKKNIDFIDSTIQNAINFKSKICSGILGAYAGEILLDEKTIEYRDLLVINALQEMYD